MIVGHIGGGVAQSYEIEKSLRFRASNSAALSRTPGAAGDRKLLVQRYRIKRGTLGTLQVISSAGTASIDRFYFDTSNRLCLDVLGTARLVTTPVYRDPSAWHVDVGFELDVANGTAANRAKILIDGVEATYSTDGRASITNTDTNWNNTVIQYIGRDNAGNYLDGYLAEPVQVDGSKVVTYSETADGIRVPVPPSATYGTCGSFLMFDDGSNLTELCRDRSGNGNHWTASGISLTSGVTYDWMDDTPTNNFAVLNPLAKAVSETVIPVAANLNLTNTGTNYGAALASFGMSEGLWYCEHTITASSSLVNARVGGGVAAFDSLLSSYLYDTAKGWAYASVGYLYTGGVATSASTGAIALNDVVMMAFDADTGNLWFGKNGTWANSGNPSTGANPAYTLPSSGKPYFFGGWSYTTTDNVAFNFGQRPFAYSPPTGFEALCTKNLTSDTITTSGTFTGSASADGPFVWLNGNPVAMTINGNAVTFATHADKTAGGFRVRTSSSSYNAAGSNSYVVTTAGKPFNAPNTAQVNP